MNKENLDYNLNKSPAIKGGILGTGAAAVLTAIPEIATHPKAIYLISMLVVGGISIETWNRLKNQMIKNEDLINKNNIKNYKNPAGHALNCGLFGNMTFTSLLPVIDNQQLFHILVMLLSAGFCVVSANSLKNIIINNKKQIDKAR